MRKVVMILLTLVMVLSCSKFTYSGADNDLTSLKVEVLSIDTTQVYRLMASRMVNAVHYVWEVDTLAHKVACGEYYATAFYANDTLYRIEGLDAFMAESSVSMQDVYACVVGLEQEVQDKMAAYNPYASCVKPADKPLMCAFSQISLVDSIKTVRFVPKSLTQSLNFRLKIRPKDGVHITSVRAAVSGVAGRVRLMSGLIRNDAANPTYRQYVEMSAKDIASGIQLYEGTADVLGLFPASSGESQAGPGVFQVEVCAELTRDGGLVQRTFYAGINMKKVIEDAALMEQASDRSGFRIIRHHATLDVPAVLEVGADKLVSGEGEGFQKWFVNDADIEIEI
jgi:hypothetical protein